MARPQTRWCPRASARYGHGPASSPKPYAAGAAGRLDCAKSAMRDLSECDKAQRRQRINTPMRPTRSQRNYLPPLLVAVLFASLAVASFCPAGAQEIAARHGMVVAQEARAARIGLEVLKKG